jgi:hypothetical protein
VKPDALAVGLVVRALPGPAAPPLRSSRCRLRSFRTDRGTVYFGTLLVVCGEREAVLSVVLLTEHGRDYADTHLLGAPDPCALRVPLHYEPGAPYLETDAWDFLDADFAVKLRVERSE